ncbi:integrase, catalytic region, zinc finger, CCHC-type containing protein [Tanacetum coccineum]
MSTSKNYQQSLADAGSENRPPMLERGSYIPWASRFRRYINRKRENRKWLKKAFDEGPYVFKKHTPTGSTVEVLQTTDDLQGDALLYYDAEIELMNLILLSIPNDIYNSVDACSSARDMWQRVERLMRGTIQNQVDRETRFTNEFDQFLTTDSFDDFFDYLQQFEKLVNASRAKKLEKSHDPLALVAHTGSSSRNTSSYYVTHPKSVVDYEEEYQQDEVQSNTEDPLTSAMLLLARSITQNFSNPTNNRLRASSNTRNQAIIQGDRVNIQSRNSGNNGRNPRRSYGQEEVSEGSNVQTKTGTVQRILRLQEMLQLFNATTDEAGVIFTAEQNYFLFADASRMEEIEELSANICLMARIQPADHNSDDEPSYDSAFISEVQSSSINDNQEQMYPIHSKIINTTIGDDQINSNIVFDTPNGSVNSGSIEKDTHVPDLSAIEQLARNAYQEAEKQQLFAQQVQQQNMTLSSQLELYKEKVRVLETIKTDNKYLNEFIEADRKAKHYSEQAQSQFIRDRDIIRDLEKQRDKLTLDVTGYKRNFEELQKSQSILKRQMSEKEDRYHDTVLDLEAKLKKNEDLFLKLGNSMQGMLMLGPKPLSVYDPQLKHGLGYLNPYTLKQAVSKCPKLYLASNLKNHEIPLDVRDTEDTLDDASKNFVPQKELSAEQTYFSSTFIPSEKVSKATPSIPAQMPSESPLIIQLYKMTQSFQMLSELIQKNCKRENIFFISPAEIRLNKFCHDQVQPSLNDLRFYMDNFRTLFQKDIKDMKDVFESTENELCETKKQNDFLQNQFLEASIRHDVEISVLLNHECEDKSLHAELEHIKKKSIETQEALQTKIQMLESDVQRCQKQSLDFQLKLQHEKEKQKWESTLKNKNGKPLDYSRISKMEKLEKENVSLDFQVQSLVKERENIKLEYQKLFDSIKKTRSQTQKEIDELITHVSEKTYAYGAIRAENLELLITISELKTRLKSAEKGMYKVVTTQESQSIEAKHGLSSTGLNAASSVRRPMNRDTHIKNSVLAISKNSAKKVGVYVRKNKQSDNTSEHVASKKENVIDVDVANAPKAKNLLCVCCMKDVLIPCHDKCLANYKLNVNSNVRRAFSTNSRTSKSSDTTYVGSKTRFSEKVTQSKPLDTTSLVFKSKIGVASTSKEKPKVSSESKTKNRNMRNNFLIAYMKKKYIQVAFGKNGLNPSPMLFGLPLSNNSTVLNHNSTKNNGCSKHMTGDRSLLRNFIEKFTGTVRFGNDNFAAITGYGDYIQGNITIFHVYYVEGLGHNLFSVGQFCDGDLEVAFRSKTYYVQNLEGDDLLIGGRESNLYTISISDMAASSPVCLMSKATSTKSWLWHHRPSHLNFGTINDLTRLDLVDGLPKFKYGKDHLYSACERGKSKKASHPPKLLSSDHSKLELLHMDLCGPMRVSSINGKKYILVIVDDYS